MRIGIHVGSVVAGVIGRRKFSYDVWGDTVNTASRLESHGEPGRIHVSEAVYLRRLRDTCAFEPRGIIEVKGKGPLNAYFLGLPQSPRRRGAMRNDRDSRGNFAFFRGVDLSSVGVAGSHIGGPPPPGERARWGPFALPRHSWRGPSRHGVARGQDTRWRAHAVRAAGPAVRQRSSPSARGWAATSACGALSHDDARCYEPSSSQVGAEAQESAEANAALTAEIAERRRVETALRASGARYRAVVDSQTDLICRYLPDTTLTFVNEAYCPDFFGRTAKS